MKIYSSIQIHCWDNNDYDSKHYLISDKIGLNQTNLIEINNSS